MFKFCCDICLGKLIFQLERRLKVKVHGAGLCSDLCVGIIQFVS